MEKKIKEQQKEKQNYEANPALQILKRLNQNQSYSSRNIFNNKILNKSNAFTSYQKTLNINTPNDLKSLSQTIKALNINQNLPKKNNASPNKSQNIIYSKKNWVLQSPSCYKMKKTNPLIFSKTTPRNFIPNYSDNDKNDITLTADTTFSKKLNVEDECFLNNTMTYFDNSFLENPFEEKSAILNIEDILMISDKYISIINSIKKGNVCADECFEWWNFYFNSSLYNQFDKYFVVEKNKKVIQYANNQELFSIILCYDLSFQPILYNHLCSLLLELILHHYNILLLISKYLYSKIIISGYNIWVKKLEEMIKNTKSDLCYIIEEIKGICRTISNIQRVILRNYGTVINYKDNSRKIKELANIYRNIPSMKIEQLNNFYRDKIYKILNKKGSVLASTSYMEENKGILVIDNKIPVPYLNKESLKKYTLVLDLDETLIHFKIDPENETKGVLQFRPGLFEFLNGINKFYELVVFTASTQDYADHMINLIEQEKIYFDYRLYRNHTTIIGRDFIKDISKLGRDLSRIIIVDNMAQNFRLQKENGITIKSFWGKEVDDRALIDLLPILLNIAKNNMDVRSGIVYYKNDILNKVTSNIYRSS